MATDKGDTIVMIGGEGPEDGDIVIMIGGEGPEDGDIVIMIDDVVAPVNSAGAPEMVWDYLFTAEFPASSINSGDAAYYSFFNGIGNFTGAHRIETLPSKYTRVRVVYDAGAVFIKNHYAAAIVFMTSVAKTTTLTNPGNYSSIAGVEASMEGRFEEIALGLSKKLGWGVKWLSPTDPRNGSFTYKVYGGYPKDPEAGLQSIMDDINRTLAG